MRHGNASSYDDLEALPQAMGDGLQSSLRAPWENAAHGSLERVATVAATFLDDGLLRRSSMMPWTRSHCLDKLSVFCGATCDTWGSWDD